MLKIIENEELNADVKIMNEEYDRKVKRLMIVAYLWGVAIGVLVCSVIWFTFG